MKLSPQPWYKLLYHLPLQAALIIPFVLQLVGTVALVGYLSYRSGQESVAELRNRLMLEVGDRLRENLQTYLEIPEFATATTRLLISNDTLQSDDLPALEKHFIEQLAILPDLTTLAIANEQGDFLSVERLQANTLAIRRLKGNSPNKAFYRYQGDQNGNHLILQEIRYNFNPHNDPPGNPWYRRARQSKSGIWTLAISLSRGQDQPILHLVRFIPFQDANGEFQGILGASYYLDELGNYLRRLQIGNHSQILLIERNGNLVATSTGEIPFDQTPRENLADNVAVKPRRLLASHSQNSLTRQVAQSLEQQGLLVSESGQISPIEPHSFSAIFGNQTYWVKVIPSVSQLDWITVIVIPESEYFSKIIANTQRTIALCIITLIISVTLEWLMVRSLTKPLVQLQKNASAEKCIGDRQRQSQPASFCHRYRGNSSPDCYL